MRPPWFIPPLAPRLSLSSLGEGTRTALMNPSAEDAVSSLERALAEALVAPEVVMMPSVRLAFLFIFKHLGMNIGDRMILPALGSTAAAAAAVALGGKLVFVDSLPGHFLADPEHAAALTSGRGASARILIASHVLGFPADVPRWQEIASATSSVLIEDGGSAPLARVAGRPTGSWGRAAVFSAGIRSPLCALGGAFVVCRDPQLAGALRNEVATLPPNSRWGQLSRLLAGLVARSGVPSAVALALGGGEEGLPGGQTWTAIREHLLEEVVDLWGERTLKRRSHRPAASQAGVARSLLADLPQDAAERREHWQIAATALTGIPGVHIPLPLVGSEPTPTSLPLLVESPREVARRLLRTGVIAWDQPMLNAASLPLFQPYRENLPHSSDTTSRLLHLPLALSRSESTLARVARTLRSIRP